MDIHEIKEMVRNAVERSLASRANSVLLSRLGESGHPSVAKPPSPPAAGNPAPVSNEPPSSAAPSKSVETGVKVPTGDSGSADPLGSRRERYAVIGEHDIRNFPRGTFFQVPPGAVVTPSARELALLRGIRLEGDQPQAQIKPPRGKKLNLRVGTGPIKSDLLPDTEMLSIRQPVFKILTQEDIRSMPEESSYEAPAGTVITPSARETALLRKITLSVAGDAASPAPIPMAARAGSAGNPAAAPAGGASAGTGDISRTVAIGADHGGLEMKEDLKGYIGELGYSVVDCGTTGTGSVDYPDFAYAVASLVGGGGASKGIIVDGAGIGSCMAANKVPGVRAAMCYDISSAKNSRAHNNANVLCLGGRLSGPDLGRQITETWLATAFEGGRHAGRVDKITAIEDRYRKD